MILELTATPVTEHKPAKGVYASNVLYTVSAAELKAEEMNKMPIRLTTEPTWEKTVGAALDARAALEEAARAEEAETGEYIRPIILFQAQSASKDDPPRLTWDKLKAELLGRGIPASQIAVHTGPEKDLDGIGNMRDRACPVRFIITVSKLKEGWDCPFAYVLCSVAEQVSATAVEQILGRVLRMPRSKRKQRDALNQSYAFILSKDFNATATQLKDGLVEGAGFNRLEVAQLVTAQGNMGFGDEAAPFVSAPLTADVAPVAVVQALARLPMSVQAKVSFDTEARTCPFKGSMTKEVRNHIHLAPAAVPKVERVINRLYAKTNHFQTSAADEDDKPPFVVPMLGFNRQGSLELFSEEHLLDLPWRLDECDPAAILGRFKLPDSAKTGQIDVIGEGKVVIDFANRLQGELSVVIREPQFDTVAYLANWIDLGIPHPDITKPSAVLFITKAIEALIGAGFDLAVLARNKYDLRKAIAGLMDDLRGDRETGQYNALFATNAADFAVSAELAILFDDQSYAPN